MLIKKWVPIIIVFILGWNMALPVTEESLPWILKPIQVVHGIFLPEALLLLYFTLLIPFVRCLPDINEGRVRIFAGIITFLGFFVLISNTLNFIVGNQPVREIFEPFRLFIRALLVLCIFQWSKKYGTTLFLRVFLIGVSFGALINLYFTFIYGSMIAGIPTILGQNGPGGALAISSILAVLLFMFRINKFDLLVSISASLLGVFISTISYSKLAVLMASCTVLAWAVIMLKYLFHKKARSWIVGALIIIVLSSLYYSSAIREYYNAASYLVTMKFDRISAERNNSTATRLQYIFTTLEIITNNPIFGVGTGGFYSGAHATRDYYRTVLNESPERGQKGQTNPHNAILYYSSALGVPGFIIAVSLFLYGMLILFDALKHHGKTGLFVWFFIVLAYIVHVSTLPSLFSSMVLYLPCTVACNIILIKRDRDGECNINCCDGLAKSV